MSKFIRIATLLIGYVLIVWGMIDRDPVTVTIGYGSLVLVGLDKINDKISGRS